MEFNKPSQFDLNGNVADNFRTFQEEVEIYFIATETGKKPKEVQVARLKNLMGPEALKLYRSITQLKPEEETVAAILEQLRDHCTPKRNETMALYKFFSRKQATKEPFEKFYADLKQLIKAGEFGDQEDKLLKTQIVLGTNSPNIQERLLREDLTLERTVEFCKSVEVANQNMRVINEQIQDEEVHKLVTRGNVKESGKFNASSNNKIGNDSRKNINSYKCYKCNYKHNVGHCSAKGKLCNFCNKPDHFASVCRFKSKNTHKQKLVHACKVDNKSENDVDINMITYSMSTVSGNKNNRGWFKDLMVNNKSIRFKLDSGAQVNTIPLEIIQKFKWLDHIKSTNVKLCAYGGFKVEPIGTITAKIEHNENIVNAKFYVVKNDLPILGLLTCVDLKCIARIDSVTVDSLEKERFIQNNIEVFRGLGEFPDQYHIKIKENATPVAASPRRVPFQIKDKLKRKLEVMVNDKIITPVNNPDEWVHNVVVIEKPDKSLRVCIDPTELNKNVIREVYTIPSFEEISPNLAGKNIFCVFDLKDGFHQIKLDEQSSKLCTFSTPFGCYRFLRAPFGLSSVPEVFQRLTQKYFGNIKGVTVYFDDILCAASSKEELDEIITQVLAKAREYNIKFNINKLQYYVTEVKYFGFIFDKIGMRPDKDRIQAIQQLKHPKNKLELQKILGAINYLRSFIPNLSELISPFRDLLKNDTAWLWTTKHEDLLNKIKEIISNATVLVPFDPRKEITIQCDASKDAVGCCLFQENKPIAFASRSLTKTESEYAQIEKELLSVCFACQKFHNYVYGHQIQIFNDHKPLVSLMKKNLREIKNNRLKRLRMKLLLYTFDLKYLPGSKLYIADLLSRNFIKNVEIENEQPLSDIIHTVTEGSISISESRLKEFQKQTSDDSVLQKVKYYYQNGWPSACNTEGELRHYFKIKNDITVENNLVYYKDKLIIPKALRKFMLKLLHETHLGIGKVNEVAKNNLYWPAMRSDIDNHVNSCQTCIKYSPSKTKSPLLCHEIPQIPYFKVGVDIAEYAGCNYLVVYDYYSRWLELEKLKNKDSQSVIKKLKEIFSHNGIPKILVADNMPFNSFEMHQFANDWNFEIVTSSPHHHQSNGLAEKGVHIAKNMLKKAGENNQDIELYLLNYRNSPVCNLKYTPAQLMSSRMLRSKIPCTNNMLMPTLVNTELVHKEMLCNQRKQKVYYDKHAKLSDQKFYTNEKVWLQNIHTKLWEKATIIKPITERSYLIKTFTGRYYRRNEKFIKKNGNSDHLDIELNNNNTNNVMKENEGRPKRTIRQPERLNL